MGLGLVAAGVGAAGAVAGAAISSSGAKSAAKTSAAAADRASQLQAETADKATQVQKDMFAQTTANNKPFLTTGTSALNQLAGLYGLDTVDANGNTVKGTGTGANIDPNATFYQTPDYKFALEQGIKGTDAGAAARGMLDSGATRKAEIAYASNLASGTFNSYADRLRQIAGIGQNAANSQANAGQSTANAITNIDTGTANNQANIITGNAANQANAQIAGASATSQAIQNLAGIAQYSLGKNPFGSSYAGSIANAANGVTPQAPWGSYNGTGVIY